MQLFVSSLYQPAAATCVKPVFEYSVVAVAKVSPAGTYTNTDVGLLQHKSVALEAE